jgi:outer membrane protein assembly factor BamA
LGAGYLLHVGNYNSVDVRGSYTFSGYKRIETEYRAPRLFGRRATLSVLGGWREATQVGFYGTGNDSAEEDRVNYSFRQPYASATLEFRPAPRHWVVFVGGLEYSQWEQRAGNGTYPSVEEVYTSDTLPGLGAKPTYLQATTTAAIDWRDAPDYSRRGGYYGVTWHGYSDGGDDPYGFGQVDYEVIQHIPLFRDAWVLSLRGKVATTYTSDGETIPFFMLPAVGGGSSLRGYSSWRFRDNHSLLLQAEWRTLVSNYFDLAIFYDAGKVTARKSDLNLDGLKSDVGVGLRLHGPMTTPVRIEFAKGTEGLHIVFAAHATF